MPEINHDLIIKALGLCGKTMGDVMENIGNYHKNDMGLETYEYSFSYPKFYAYLLSPEFIENYLEAINWQFHKDYCDDSYPEGYLSSQIGTAIYEYQSGNIEPLTQLLKKI